MGNIFYILMIAAMASVLASLFIGLFYMAKEGKENRKMSNRMMQLRVGLQALALVMFALALVTSGS